MSSWNLNVKSRMLSVVLVLLALAVLPSGSTADSGDMGSERTHQSAPDFVRSLYAGYAPKMPTPNPTGPQAAQIFAKSTLALIRKDQEVPKGQMGALDFDPVCDCQDYEDLRNVVLSTIHNQDGSVAVKAQFLNFGKRKTVRFDLLLEDGGWRVYDIHASLAPSLRKLLSDR